ncbi:IS256 family transposase [Caloramator australicus]|uniref:Mutator family transposase n=1 Tax=Caloramator australicus RC3 TaxID=857293 RepID=I7KAE0_9CLOT|nr:IS256 family transposase [Caloramator australicus]CCJ34717.1 putative transposase [Caloramator australicus RC3]
MSLLTKEQLRGFIKENNLQTVPDIYNALKELFKETLQEMLEAELATNLGYEKYEKKDKETTNSRNGYSQKTVKTQFGEMELNIPRDREGEFEPIIVPKHKRDISGIEEKIISLYARGMSTRDIHEQIKDIYGIEVSAEMVSKITDRIIPEIREWQSRPLEKIYPFIFMDAIHYKVRTENHIINKAAYIVLGITIEGTKDILGIWIGENETSRFWLGVLNELKNRGVEDVLIFSVDGLSGLKEAIEATFPKAEIQRCIIHQLRNCFKYVSYKHLKEFSKDFKAVYQAASEEIARDKFEEVKKKWQSSYPFAIKSWENNWEVLIPFYKFPEEIRKIMYTTNIIEGFHRQLRKVTKSKAIFPNDESLEKMLFLVAKNVMKKWTQRYKNWDMVLNQLMIMYPERVEKFIK